jgi:DNA polymerase III sliding clamp (beta) subunit (PCNA family)
MNTTTDRAALLQALSLVRPALATQNYVPALTHICFDGMSAIAYNDVSSISVRSSLDIEKTLPGEMLIKALGTLQTAEVAFKDSDEPGSITLVSGKAKIKLAAMAIADYPMPELPTEAANTVMVLLPDFFNALALCLPTVGVDSTHPSHMGVTMECADKHIHLFTTDNYTITRAVSPYTFDEALPGDPSIIMPTFFCQQLLALEKAYQGEEILLEIHDGALIAKFGDMAVLFHRLLVDLEPVDFAKQIKRYVDQSFLDKNAAPIPDEFEAAFERACMISAEDDDKVTEMSVSSKRLLMSTSSSTGQATDAMTYPIDVPKFLINPALVLRASKRCTKLAMMPNVMVLLSEDRNYMHLIAHRAGN